MSLPQKQHWKFYIHTLIKILLLHALSPHIPVNPVEKFQSAIQLATCLIILTTIILSVQTSTILIT